MAFIKRDGINLLSLVFVDGSNDTFVIRSDDVKNFPLLFSHHLHHK
ncbi:MAG: hypothetical protein HWN81_19870 [Candidatus Lokiarchaeota archaeon]|nr:hypothetical protein [Candidatus Lokiarchaeota archaeon]